MTARRALLATILILAMPIAFASTSQKSKTSEKPAVDPDLPAATVLCYHIVEAPSDDRMEISRETFRQHLRYLEMTGYNVIPMKDLYEYVTGKRDSLPKNAVVITIDDGWRSTYTEAFPELQKRKFPFTVFIYPNIIGNATIAMTWKQIREMAEAGVDIQSHSLSHPYLSRRKHEAMDDEAYAKWLRNELRESRRILEKETGKSVRFLAYPYGDFDHNVANAAAAAGYDAAFTCVFGRVRRGTDLMHVNRVVIDKRMDFAEFRHYLGTKPMELADMTPAPKSPADPSVTTISAKIPNYKNLDPQTVGMALLSAASALPFSYDAKDGSISIVMRDALSSLGARYHRAIVWGVDRKTRRRVEATWMIRLPDPNAPLQPPPATSPAPAVTAPAVSAGMMGGGSPR